MKKKEFVKYACEFKNEAECEEELEEEGESIEKVDEEYFEEDAGELTE